MHETNVSQIVLYVLDLEYNQGINFTSPFQPLIPLHWNHKALELKHHVIVAWQHETPCNGNTD